MRPWASGVRSTIPVSSFGPRPTYSGGLVDTWCHTCSSAPRWVTPSKRARSPAAAYNSGMIASHMVCQPQPS